MHRAFMWRPEGRLDDGISIPWTSVSLHAITSEPRSVYLQLDLDLLKLKWPGVYDGTQGAGGGRVQANGHNGIGDAGEELMDGVQHQPAPPDDEDEGNVSGELKVFRSRYLTF